MGEINSISLLEREKQQSIFRTQKHLGIYFNLLGIIFLYISLAQSLAYYFVDDLFQPDYVIILYTINQLSFQLLTIFYFLKSVPIAILWMLITVNLLSLYRKVRQHILVFFSVIIILTILLRIASGFSVHLVGILDQIVYFGIISPFLFVECDLPGLMLVNFFEFWGWVSIGVFIKRSRYVGNKTRIRIGIRLCGLATLFNLILRVFIFVDGLDLSFRLIDLKWGLFSDIAIEEMLEMYRIFYQTFLRIGIWVKIGCGLLQFMGCSLASVIQFEDTTRITPIKKKVIKC